MLYGPYRSLLFAWLVLSPLLIVIRSLLLPGICPNSVLVSNVLVGKYIVYLNIDLSNEEIPPGGMSIIPTLLAALMRSIARLTYSPVRLEVIPVRTGTGGRAGAGFAQRVPTFHHPMFLIDQLMTIR